LRVVGTPQAEDLLDLFVSLSLRKLFSDAFGQKFETEEMQAWLLIRTQGIEKRNEWTAGIKAYGETHEVSDNWKKFVYCNMSDRLNQALTGQKAKYWCDLLECIPSTLRDHWEASHLSNVEAIERHALVLLNKGVEPRDALEAAIEFFDFPVNETPHQTISKAAQYKRDRRAKGLAN
jgi:hypothetical protein